MYYTSNDTNKCEHRLVFFLSIFRSHTIFINTFLSFTDQRSRLLSIASVIRMIFLLSLFYHSLLYKYLYIYIDFSFCVSSRACFFFFLTVLFLLYQDILDGSFHRPKDRLQGNNCFIAYFLILITSIKDI